MTIYIGTDHAGFELKEKLVPYVRDVLGYEVVDCGAKIYDKEDDYPTYVATVGKAVSEEPRARVGILLGGSGQGEAIVANRFPYVRTTVYYGGPTEILTLGRDHNDANVLSLGARFLDEQEVKDAVQLWLQTPFSKDPRHVRRITMIDRA